MRGLCAHLSSLQFPPLRQSTSQRASLLVTITTSQGGLSSPGIDGDSLGVSKPESQAGKRVAVGVSSLLSGPWAGPSPLMASHDPGRPLPSTGSSPRDHRRPGGRKSPAKPAWPASSALDRWLQQPASALEGTRGRTSAALAPAPNSCCPRREGSLPVTILCSTDRGSPRAAVRIR